MGAMVGPPAPLLVRVAGSVMPKKPGELGPRVGRGDGHVGQDRSVGERRARGALLLLGEEAHGLGRVGARPATERHDAVDAVPTGLAHGGLHRGGGHVGARPRRRWRPAPDPTPGPPGRPRRSPPDPGWSPACTRRMPERARTGRRADGARRRRRRSAGWRWCGPRLPGRRRRSDRRPTASGVISRPRWQPCRRTQLDQGEGAAGGVDGGDRAVVERHGHDPVVARGPTRPRR